MTANQKAYCNSLRMLAIGAVLTASIAVIGTTFGEPANVEYDSHIIQK